MRRICVLNTKGGCGKTTIATNLASCYASAGIKTALFDYDPQGSSTRWLKLRPEEKSTIHGVAAFESTSAKVTRSWQLRIPSDTDRVIIDTPAGINGGKLADILRDSDTILIPVLPSSIDIHATADFLRDLLLVEKIRRNMTSIGIIANRVKPNTKAYQALERFLDSLDIPLITQIRETQHYIHAAEQGLGIHEIKSTQTQQDKDTWSGMLNWLEKDSEVSHKLTLFSESKKYIETASPPSNEAPETGIITH